METTTIESEDGNRAAVETAVTIAIDWHADQYTICVQVGGALAKPPQKLRPEQALEVVKGYVKSGRRVYTCYEIGPGGFVLHRQLEALGATNYVVAPEEWCAASRVKNDRRDAREMGRRLASYVKGNTEAFTTVYVPTEEQERWRGFCRQREMYLKERKRCEGRGFGLLLKQGVRAPRQWWTEEEWAQLQGELPDWLRQQLQPWRAQAQTYQALIDEITPRIEQRVAGRQWPSGLGALTLALIEAEICDWQKRFTGRRGPAGYCGLVPSEHTSNHRRRQGSVTKYGNPRLRHLLVEAVWRMIARQPDYPPLRRLQGTSGKRRKVLVVAAARRLMVDLWRLYTNRNTAEQLKLRLNT